MIKPLIIPFDSDAKQDLDKKFAKKHRFMGSAHRSMVSTLALASMLLASAAQGVSLSAIWSELQVTSTPTGAPAARGWVDLIYDPVAQRTVLFGGSGQHYFNDILNFNVEFAQWTEVEPFVWPTTAIFPPCGRDEHAVEYDSYNRLYWSVGGSGYDCSGSKSQTQTGTNATAIVDSTLPSTVNDFYRGWLIGVRDPESQGAVYTHVDHYDSTTKRLTLTSPLSPLLPGITYYIAPQMGGGTWSYDPSTRTWRGLDSPAFGYTGPNPPSRLSPAFAYSPASSAAVMFGGDFFNDTWMLDARTQSWVRMMPDGSTTAPPARGQVTNAMAYDSANDAFVLFGGRCGDNDSLRCPYGTSLGDTWIYRLGTNGWTRLTPIQSPPARRGHTLAYDPVNKVLVLFGGFDAGTTFNDIWTYDVAAGIWTRVPTPSVAPLPRYLHAMVYDQHAARFVIYGGNEPGGVTVSSVWTLRLIAAGQNQPPTAVATVSPATGSVGSVLNFSGSGSIDPDGSITSYSWDFGDGTSGNGVTITKTYGHLGDYVVSLTVTDNAGASSTTTLPVKISAPNVPPTAQLACSPASGTVTTIFSCSGALSADPDGSITSYVWDFGDGTTGTGTTVAKQYAAAGSYKVTLKVTDNQGATGLSDVTLVVVANNALPIARISCTPQTGTTLTDFACSAAQSSDSDGNIVAFAWDFGDGTTAASQSVTKRYSAPGTYTVGLTVTDNAGGTGTVAMVVNVTAANIPPVARIYCAPPSGTTSSIFTCYGVTSSDADGSIVSYSWSFGDGTSSTGISVSKTYASPGTYNLSLTVTDNFGEADTATSNVIVQSARPATSTTLLSLVNPAAFGNPVTLLASVGGAAGGGQVAFREDGVAIPDCAAVPIVRGAAKCVLSTLAAGSHRIIASYGGDAGSSPSASAVLNQVVSAPGTPSGTVTEVASSINPAKVGARITFTATVTGAAPTGTVNMMEGGVPIPSCAALPLNGSGNSRTAQCSTTSLTIGNHPVQAVYGGDSRNSGSTSPPLQQVVTSISPGR